MEKAGSLHTVSRIKTRQIAIIGMLSAISMMLGLTGYGFIPLPTTQATIMHIPVIIGAILEGPLVGAMVGLLFGLFSIAQSLTSPTLLSFAFVNPLVSVLPRVLIGIVAAYSYKWAWNRHEGIRVGISALLGTLTNTVGVLSMIYFLYAAQFAAARGIDLSAAAKVIYGVALMNGIPEAIISMAICIPVVTAIKRRHKK